MNKKTILARFKAANIEVDPDLSLEELKTIAATKGVVLGAPASTVSAPEGEARSSDPGASSPAGDPGTGVAADTPVVPLSLTPASPSGFTEEQIREKTSVGLNRAQAIEVLTSQAEHDARLAQEAKARG